MFCHCEACKKARKLGGKNIRTRSQAIVDNRLLIDFCADTYMHVLQQGLPLEDIQLILKLEDDAENLSERLVYKTVCEFEPFKVLDYVVTPLLAKHMQDEKCYIYMIEDKFGKTMLYGNDTSWFPEETWMYLKGHYFDMVSLDCTTVFGEDCQSHMGFAGDVKTKEKLLAMGCADENTTFVITHFSHNGLASHEEIEVRAAAEGFLTAYDGFETEF